MAHGLMHRQAFQAGCGPQRPRTTARRCVISTPAAPTAYATTPSSKTGGNELQELSRLSQLVVDQNVLSTESILKPTAVTITHSTLHGIVSKRQLGVRANENAVATAMNADDCMSKKDPAQRFNCQVAHAFANVASIAASEVAGRVCIDSDPRLAHDTAKLVAQIKGQAALLKAQGVGAAKCIFRLPATWHGIQAAKQLQAEGIVTQVWLVFSKVQGVAAMQAGVSIVQPNVGRLRDWYSRHPNAPRDSTGPREDGGYMSSVDPGRVLVATLFTYAKKFHASTSAIMASGLRNKEDALALAGCDYLVLPGRVVEQLAATSTLAGFNDGLSATEGALGSGVTAALSLDTSRAADIAELPAVSESDLKESMGPAAKELLTHALEGLVEDVNSLGPFFGKVSIGAD